MKPKVYLETSFISYLAGRLSLDLITLRHQIISQRWWADERQHFDLFVSQTVHREYLQGNQEAVKERSAILQGYTFIALEWAYIRNCGAIS